MPFEISTCAGDSLYASFRDDFIRCQAEVRSAAYAINLSSAGYWQQLMDAPGKAQYFLLKNQDRLLGRCAVFFSEQNSSVAYLGGYESLIVAEDRTLSEAHSRHLLKAAVEWAKENGATTLYGPIDKNTWYNYRFRSDSYQESRSWEPVNPPDYIQLWQDFGFQVEETYKSFAYKKKFGITMRTATWLFYFAYRSTLKRGYTVRPMDSVWEINLPIIYELGLSSFPSNFLFEPISYENFLKLYEAVGTRADISPSFFLFDADGKAAGFVLSYYDQDYIVVKTIGIRKDLQGRGLGRSLIYATLKHAADSGIIQGIGALIRQGNRSEVMSQLIARMRVGKWTHVYQLLVMHLK